MNLKSEKGGGIVEYLLLLAILVVISLGALKGFGEQLGLTYSEISSTVGNVLDNPNGYVEVP